MAKMEDKKTVSAESTESLENMSFPSPKPSNSEKIEKTTRKKTSTKVSSKDTDDSKAETTKKRSTAKNKEVVNADGETKKRSASKKKTDVEDPKEVTKKSSTSGKKATAEDVEVKKGDLDTKKEEKLEVASVTIGNYVGNKGRNAKYRCCFDVVVTTNAGHVMNYVYIDDFYGGCITNYPSTLSMDELLHEEPFELARPKEVTLEKLPDILTKAIFDRLYPGGSEEEYWKFVFGEEVGAQVYNDYKWAEENPISKERDVTLDIRDEIGEIRDIRLDGEEMVNRGQGQKNLYYTITDDKGELWKVTVYENRKTYPPYDTFKVERVNDNN